MPVVFSADGTRLEPGIQQATVAEVEAALVTSIPGSTTRRPIFTEWVALRAEIDVLVKLGVQWVDGSFAGPKIDPNDVDVATFLDGVEVEQLDTPQEEALNALFGGNSTRGFPRCDSFLIVIYPREHPLYGAYQAMRETFAMFYGHDSRTGTDKGFLEVDP